MSPVLQILQRDIPKKVVWVTEIVLDIGYDEPGDDTVSVRQTVVSKALD